MPTLAQIRTRVDAWLAARWPVVVARQETYREVHGTYWQGLRSHGADLDYTSTADAERAADNLDSRPSDVAESWLGRFPELAAVTFPAVLWCDVYDGPEGQGFVATVRVRVNGRTYERAQNRGPETWRTHDWREI